VMDDEGSASPRYKIPRHIVASSRFSPAVRFVPSASAPSLKRARQADPPIWNRTRCGHLLRPTNPPRPVARLRAPPSSLQYRRAGAGACGRPSHRPAARRPPHVCSGQGQEGAHLPPLGTTVRNCAGYSTRGARSPKAMTNFSQRQGGFAHSDSELTTSSKEETWRLRRVASHRSMRQRVSPARHPHTAAVAHAEQRSRPERHPAWLGHVDLRTTNIYAEIISQRSAKALDTCLPLVSPGLRRPSWKRDEDLLAWLEHMKEHAAGTIRSSSARRYYFFAEEGGRRSARASLDAHPPP